MTVKAELNFVVHRGKLENQALLLASSLRYYNGDDFILNACIPKDFGGIDSGVSPLTKKRLLELDVKLKEVENPISNEYLIGNKLMCLDDSDGNYRVFLDTDIICCNKLNLPDLEKNSIAVKPADRKTYHWDRKTWQKAYKKYADYNLLKDDIVISTAFDEVMLPYFNAGVVIINGCSDFSQQWANVSKKLDGDKDFYGKRPWLDQLSLPLTIKKLKLDLYCLTETHNFPANIKPVLFTGLQLVHYHRPDLISRNVRLIKCITKIILRFPWLKDIFENEEWAIVNQSLNSQKEINPKKYLIASFSKELLNQFSFIALQNPKNKVSCYPANVLAPLRKRNIPWGVNAYYADTVRDLKISQENIENLFSCHGMTYIINLPRLLRVLPHTIFIGVYEEPIKTITLWNEEGPNNDYIPSNDQVLNENRNWLEADDIQLIDEIEQAQSKIIRQALYWNLYAIQFIKHQRNLVLVKFKDSYELPSALSEIVNVESISGINEMKDNSIFSSNLSVSEKQTVKNITSQLYQELKNIEVIT